MRRCVMRDFDSEWLDLAIAPSREISIQPIFRNFLPQFTDYNSDDVPVVDSPHDVDYSGFTLFGPPDYDFVLRAARWSTDNTLRYDLIGDSDWEDVFSSVWITALDGDSDPILVDSDSRVGVVSKYIWFVSDAGELCFWDTEDGPATAPTIRDSDIRGTMGVPAGTYISLAPTTASAVYLLAGPNANGNYKLFEYNVTAGVYGAAVREFPGEVYCDVTSPAKFDAVRSVVNDVRDYVFVTDRDSGRLMFITVVKDYDPNRIIWSDAQLVMPLDVVDVDWSTFEFGGASYFGPYSSASFIWVTGRLKRGDIEMDIYLKGRHGRFSLAREMFISHDFASHPVGKLVSNTFDYFTPGKVMYVGYGAHSVAQATPFFGGYATDDDTMELLTVDLSVDINSAARITASMSTDASDNANLKRNAQVEIQLGYRDSDGVFDYETLGYYGIDVIQPIQDEEGLALGIGGRGWAGKRIDQWVADQSYEYWSQTKMYAAPADRTDTHFARGRWETDSDDAYLYLDELNLDGFLYSVHKPSRGASVSARFYIESGGIYEGSTTGYEGHAGVALNYFRQTQLAAAADLGIESEDVADSDYGNNAIVLHVSNLDYSSFWLVQNDNWTQIGAFAYPDFPDDEWFWVQASFQDGHLRAMWRMDSDVDWIEIFDTQYDLSPSPWYRADDEVGRGAVYLKAATYSAQTPGFSSSSMVIPVESTPFGSSSGHVLVDTELIEYDAVNIGPAGHSLLDSDDGWWDSEGVGLLDDVDLLVADGQTWQHAHQASDSDWWRGRAILWQGDPNGASPQALAIGKSSSTVVYAGQAWSRGSYDPKDWPYRSSDSDHQYAEYTTIGVELYVRKVGTPSHPLYVYYASDNFDEANPPDQAAILAVATINDSDVDSDFMWVKVNWDSDVPWRGTDNDWIYVTTMPAGDTSYATYQDANNYYEIMIDETLANTLGVSRFWRSGGGWDFWYQDSDDFSPTNIDGGIVHRIWGHSSFVQGYEVFVHGDDFDALEKALRDGFDNLALVVVDGPGEGTAFRICDYEYVAPNQWVQTRSYFEPDYVGYHVGDSDHGYWTGDFYLARFGVTTDPGGILVPEESVVRVYKTLSVAIRGDSDADAVLNGGEPTGSTAHGATTVSMWDPARVRIDRMTYYSTEVDQRAEDAIAEIAAKAGVFDVSAEKWIDPSDSDARSVNTDSDTGWAFPEPIETGLTNIIRFDISTIVDDAERGFIFRMNVAAIDLDDSDLTEYYAITTGHDSDNEWFLNFYKGSVTPIETVPLAHPLTDMLTISVQEEHFSVWCNDRYLWTFYDSDYETGPYASLFGKAAVPGDPIDFVGNGGDRTLDWSAVGRLIDGFIMDMGSRGSQLVGDVIGRTDRRVLTRDTQAGGIHIQRMRFDGAADFTLPDFEIKHSERDMDIDYKSFIRSEGAGREAAIFSAEVVDWDVLKSEGLLFDYANAPLANNEWETYQEASYALRDAASSAYAVSVDSPIDPRPEPGDIVNLQTPDELISAMRLTIDSVSMRWSQEEASFVADMNMHGRRIVIPSLEYDAEVSPLAVVINLPSVGALSDLAVVSPVTIPIVLPSVSGSYELELSAAVSPVMITINLPTVTPTFVGELLYNYGDYGADGYGGV